jgi:hypothetical protein
MERGTDTQEGDKRNRFRRRRPAKFDIRLKTASFDSLSRVQKKILKTKTISRQQEKRIITTTEKNVLATHDVQLHEHAFRGLWLHTQHANRDVRISR